MKRDTLSDLGLRPLVDEIGALIDQRERDPKWQARQRQLERETAFEMVQRQHRLVDAALRGDHGSDAQELTKKLLLEHANNRTRRLLTVLEKHIRELSK